MTIEYIGYIFLIAIVLVTFFVLYPNFSIGFFMIKEKFKRYIVLVLEIIKSIKFLESCNRSDGNDLFWKAKLKEQITDKQEEIFHTSEALKCAVYSLNKIYLLKARFQKDGKYCKILKYWEDDLNEIFTEAEKFSAKEKFNVKVV